MNEIETQTVPADAVETPETETEDDGVLKVSDVAKRYFSPDGLADGVAYINKVTAISGIKIQTNFDMEDEDGLPDGYGLAVLPIIQRKSDGTGNETLGVAIAAVPDPSTVGSHEKGGEFIRSTIIDVLCARVANAVRPRKDGTTPGSIPFKMEDFIVSGRGRESLKTFTLIAPAFVKTLRVKGLKLMTQQLLRMVLQSKEFAHNQFEKIEQPQWVMVLDAMITKAKAEGHDPAILANWKNTRDEAMMDTVDEIDFSDLIELV